MNNFQTGPMPAPQLMAAPPRTKGSWFKRKSKQVADAGDMVKAYVAELIGSFIPVTVTLLLMMYISDLPERVNFWRINVRITWYLLFLVIWSIFSLGMYLGMKIFMKAGALNPTVTLMGLGRNRIQKALIAPLILGQLSGWILAGCLVSFIHVGEVNPDALQLSFRRHGVQIGTAGMNERAEAIRFGMPMSNPLIPEDAFPIAAQFLGEVFFAAVLLLAVLLCWRRPAKAHITAIIVGLTVAFGMLLGMLTSGGALNPLVWVMASLLDWSFDTKLFMLHFVAPLTAVPVVVLIARSTE